MRDLGLSSDAACLQFAFALWAEDLAATVQGAAAGGSKKEGKKDKEGGSKAQGGKRAHGSSEPAAGGGDEQVDTSSGKDRPPKKTKT